jgi:hypothetical protein
MDRALSDYKQRAKELAAGLSRPRYYDACREEIEYAHNQFFDHSLILRLRDDVIPFIYDDFGHGIQHAKLVAIDAGALVLAALGDEPGEARRLSLLAQVCGLLHDVARLEEDHPEKSAELSRRILANTSLDEADHDIVALAIAAHEDAAIHARIDNPAAAVVSAALYDADTFRWGPDFFITTLWELCDYEEWTNADVIARFPEAMEHARNLRGTFRSAPGMEYGPEIIDTGLALAAQIMPELEVHKVQATIPIQPR